MVYILSPAECQFAGFACRPRSAVDQCIVIGKLKVDNTFFPALQY